MQLLWDLVSFCQAVFLRWSNLITGGVIAFVWLLYEKGFDRQISAKTVYWILGFGLFIATFGAWREEHQKATVQRLRGFVAPGGVITGESPDGTSIVFLIGIINSGAPTTVTGFKMDVKSGSRSWTLMPGYLPANTEFMFGEGQGTKIEPSEMIYNKLTAPIAEGGRMDGFLFYDVPGIKPREFWKENPIFTIYFFDAAGKQYQLKIERNPDGGPVPRVYVPGVNNPFLPFIGRPESPTPSPSNK